MSEELLYTSAAKGLKPGSRGFCTVQATAGMAPAIATLLESLSGYRHLGPPGDRGNPVVRRHVIVTVADQRRHVLSRLADAGADYTGRSNKLVHHLALDAAELNTAGPAWSQLQGATQDAAWDGEPRVLRAGRLLSDAVVAPRPCSAWQRATGDAGWGGFLAQRLLGGSSTPLPIIYSPQTSPLELIAETIAILPERHRWRATYTTLHNSLPPGVDCAWRFVLDGTPEALELRKRRDLERLDLTANLGPAPAGPWIEAARTGQRPEAVPTPPPPVAPSQLVEAGPPFEVAEPDDWASDLPPPPPKLTRLPRRYARRHSERDKSLSLWALASLVVAGLMLLIGIPVLFLSTIGPGRGLHASYKSPAADDAAPNPPSTKTSATDHKAQDRQDENLDKLPGDEGTSSEPLSNPSGTPVVSPQTATLVEVEDGPHKPAADDTPGIPQIDELTAAPIENLRQWTEAPNRGTEVSLRIPPEFADKKLKQIAFLAPIAIAGSIQQTDPTNVGGKIQVARDEEDEIRRMSQSSVPFMSAMVRNGNLSMNADDENHPENYKVEDFLIRLIYEDTSTFTVQLSAPQKNDPIRTAAGVTDHITFLSSLNSRPKVSVPDTHPWHCRISVGGTTALLSPESQPAFLDTSASQEILVLRILSGGSLVMGLAKGAKTTSARLRTIESRKKGFEDCKHKVNQWLARKPEGGQSNGIEPKDAALGQWINRDLKTVAFDTSKPDVSEGMLRQIDDQFLPGSRWWSLLREDFADVDRMIDALGRLSPDVEVVVKVEPVKGNADTNGDYVIYSTSLEMASTEIAATE